MITIGRRLGLSLAFAAVSCLAAGCHKKEAVLPAVVVTATPVATDTSSASPTPTASPTATASPSPTPTPTLAPASAMTTFAVSQQGGSVTLSSSGYGGALNYPSNTVTVASGSFTLSTTPNGTIPSPAPNGTPFLYFTMQLSNTVAFVGNFETSPVTLPTGLPTTGVTFVETLYDQTMGVQIGQAVTGIVNGQSVTFGSVTTGSFGATAGDVYLFVISHS